MKHILYAINFTLKQLIEYRILIKAIFELFKQRHDVAIPVRQ